jgi:putative ABC transport system ATP-binding protein
MSYIQAKGLQRVYPMGKVTVNALRGVDIDINQGEYLCICGASGAGKSTLLNLLGLLDKPSGGSLQIDGVDVLSLKPKALHRFRRQRIAFIFQSFNLIPVLTAGENIEFPLLIQKVPPAQRRQRIEQLCAEVGLADVLKHRPDELSGGQRQRVAIARALVTKPAVVFADEPTANLDSANSQIIMDLMRRLNHEEGTTFVIASHDPDVLGQADRTIHVRDGLIYHA